MFFIFFLGLIFGSFLNVCIYRIPVGLSIVKPGSHCFSCGSHVSWYDNIPLMSFIILKGQCRHCGAVFSMRYFFIELLTGLFFAFTFYKFRYTLATPFYIGFICLLIIATFTDLDHWIIPDSVSIGGAGLGMLAAIIAGFFPKGFIVSGIWPMPSNIFYAPFVNALTGAFTGAFIIWLVGVVGTLIFRKEAMGFGDVKLFLLIGSFLGALNCLYVMTVASLIGSVIGGSLLLSDKIRQKKNKKKKENKEKFTEECSPENYEDEGQKGAYDREAEIIDKVIHNMNKIKGDTDQSSPGHHHIPFGPFIAAGAIIVLYWGDQLFSYIFNLYNY